jgi:hypothetical protein
MVRAVAVVACAWGFLLACGDDDEDSNTPSDAAAEAGSGGSAGSAGSSAGEAGMDATAEEAGDAAADSQPDVQDAGGDAPVCQESYDLNYCGLLADPKATSLLIVPAYLGKVKNDCRVAKLIKPQTFDFANKLTAFTFSLWGCNDDPAKIFGLVDGITELSAADASVLIDYYVTLSKSAVGLGPKETAKLTLALECLAAQAITNPSTTEHELSICTPDGGSDAALDSASDSAADAPSEASSDASSDVEADVMDGGSD